MNKCIPYGKRRKIYESYWHCPPGGRFGKNCHSKGDQKNTENSGRRPVTHNIDRMGSFLLCNAGFDKKRPLREYLKLGHIPSGVCPVLLCLHIQLQAEGIAAAKERGYALRGNRCSHPKNTKWSTICGYAGRYLRRKPHSHFL